MSPPSLEKPAYYDATPLCLCADCLHYDLRHLDVPESPPSLSFRPSCTVAKSTSGLATVCSSSEPASVASVAVSSVSPAEPNSFPVQSVTTPQFRPFAAPPVFSPAVSSVPCVCTVAAPAVAGTFPSVRPVVALLFRPFYPLPNVWARFVALLPVLVPFQFGFVLSFLPVLC